MEISFKLVFYKGSVIAREMEKKMRKIFKILIFTFILSSLVQISFAQPVKDKKFEFSTSASVWNVKFHGQETETLINIPII